MNYIEVGPRIKGNTTDIKYQNSKLTEKYKNTLRSHGSQRETYVTNIHHS